MLDPRSHRTLVGFAVRIGFFAIVAGIPYLLGARSLRGVAMAMQMLCLYGAFFAAVFALIWREPPKAPTLNLWDESLAFGALGVLMHTVMRLLA